MYMVNHKFTVVTSRMPNYYTDIDEYSGAFYCLLVVHDRLCTHLSFSVTLKHYYTKTVHINLINK